MNQIALTIDGMTCEHCVGAVGEALGDLTGVESQSVGIGVARLAYDPGRIRPEQIREAVEEAGYTVRGMEVDR